MDEQELIIRGHASAFLFNSIASYLFETCNKHIQHTIYHYIYCDYKLVVFEGNKTVREIRDWFGGLQNIVKKASGNQHLQFTVVIFISDLNSPNSDKKDNNKNKLFQCIPLPGHEHDLVPRGRPVIWDVQEEMIEVKVCHKRNYPHTSYLTRNNIGFLSHLAKHTFTKPRPLYQMSRLRIPQSR